jgi:hypothetical protein
VQNGHPDVVRGKRVGTQLAVVDLLVLGEELKKILIPAIKQILAEELERGRVPRARREVSYPLFTALKARRTDSPQNQPRLARRFPPCSPSRPVPSNKRLAGSGTGTAATEPCAMPVTVP